MISNLCSKIYLTIDDSPSKHTDKKVAFLKANHIPALFFVRGEYAEQRPDQIINAIKNGFLIGNHSYSHPYFSNISLDQCFDEIIKTEEIIERCYKSAGVARPHKIIRLPFADRGAGAQAAAAMNETDAGKVEAIQNFLKERGFVRTIFDDWDSDGFIDSFWDWDTQDYKSRYIADGELYLDGLKQFYERYPKRTAVGLLHDFDNNHHLFEATMKFLMASKMEFLAPNFVTYVTGSVC